MLFAMAHAQDVFDGGMQVQNPITLAESLLGLSQTNVAANPSQLTAFSPLDPNTLLNAISAAAAQPAQSAVNSLLSTQSGIALPPPPLPAQSAPPELAANTPKPLPAVGSTHNSDLVVQPPSLPPVSSPPATHAVAPAPTSQQPPPEPSPPAAAQSARLSLRQVQAELFGARATATALNNAIASTPAALPPVSLTPLPASESLKPAPASSQPPSSLVGAVESLMSEARSLAPALAGISGIAAQTSLPSPSSSAPPILPLPLPSQPATPMPTPTAIVSDTATPQTNVVSADDVSTQATANKAQTLSQTPPAATPVSPALLPSSVLQPAPAVQLPASASQTPSTSPSSIVRTPLVISSSVELYTGDKITLQSVVRNSAVL